MSDSDARQRAIRQAGDRLPAPPEAAAMSRVKHAALSGSARVAWSVVGATAALVPILVMMDGRGDLFLASIGGSAIFVFVLTDAPAAQPRALVVGHLASAAIGVVCLRLLGPGLASMLIAVLVSLVVMSATRTVHPPAGANPLLVIHAGAGWPALLQPIGAALLITCVVAIVWSRIRPGVVYPTDWLACSPPRRPSG